MTFSRQVQGGLDGELRKILNNMLELEEALRVLEQFSLVKCLRGGQGIWIHCLIQEVIQHNLSEEDKAMWWDKIVKLGLDAFPHEITENTHPVC